MPASPGNWQFTSYGYDVRGNRSSITDALNKMTTFTYDTGDRLTQITAPSPNGVAPAGFAEPARARD